MNTEAVGQQIMFAAFCEELEKVAAEGGFEVPQISEDAFLEMQKEAGFLGDIASSVGKKARGALAGLGLMAGGGAQAATTAMKAPSAEAVGKFVPGVGNVTRGSQTMVRSAPGWQARSAQGGRSLLGDKVDPGTIKKAMALLRRRR